MRPSPPRFCCDFNAARVGGFAPDAFLRNGLDGFFALMDTSPVG